MLTRACPGLFPGQAECLRRHFAFNLNMLRFGVTTFPTDYGLPVIDLSLAVEERGLDSIFFNEHTHIPVSRRTAFPGGGELPKEYAHTHDPFVALGALRPSPNESC